MKARWRSHSWVAWVRISTVPPECSLERFRVSFMLQHNAFWTGFYLVILFVTKLYYTLIWYNPKTNFIIKHKAPLKMISYFYSLAFKNILHHLKSWRSCNIPETAHRSEDRCSTATPDGRGFESRSRATRSFSPGPTSAPGSLAKYFAAPGFGSRPAGVAHQDLLTESAFLINKSSELS